LSARAGERGTLGLVIREAGPEDDAVIWRVIEPVVRAGETYALPRDMTFEALIGYWRAPDHSAFVAVAREKALGTYFLCANRPGGGDHVANAAFITAEAARGEGVARAMGLDAIERARAQGFLAMQFNFVVATNAGAIRLWRSLGFEIVGRLPEAFRHPKEGLVDALIMYRKL
jgi:GNAT superfamily N-acetyltransferase